MKTIVIRSNRTARKLIQSRMFDLVDIKAHKYNSDKTVFVFELSDALISFCNRNNLEV